MSLSKGQILTLVVVVIATIGIIIAILMKPKSTEYFEISQKNQEIRRLSALGKTTKEISDELQSSGFDVTEDQITQIVNESPSLPTLASVLESPMITDAAVDPTAEVPLSSLDPTTFAPSFSSPSPTSFITSSGDIDVVGLMTTPMPDITKPSSNTFDLIVATMAPTAAPTTMAPTTAAPTTMAPTTAAPTTMAPKVPTSPPPTLAPPTNVTVSDTAMLSITNPTSGQFPTRYIIEIIDNNNNKNGIAIFTGYERNFSIQLHPTFLSYDRVIPPPRTNPITEFQLPRLHKGEYTIKITGQAQSKPPPPPAPPGIQLPPYYVSGFDLRSPPYIYNWNWDPDAPAKAAAAKALAEAQARAAAAEAQARAAAAQAEAARLAAIRRAQEDTKGRDRDKGSGK